MTERISMPYGRPGSEGDLGFDWAGARVLFTRTGELRSVESGDGPRPEWLTGGGAVRARIGGLPVSWRAPELVVDVDELEVAYGSASVTATVRHAFASAWVVRLTLANPTADTVRLDDLALSWTAPADGPAWALAAGAAAAYGVLGPDGRVLGAVLTRGEIAAITPGGFELGPVTLAPGARYVLAWEWRWFGSVRAFAAHRRRQRTDRHLPVSLVQPAGSTALVTVDEDEVLTVPAGVQQLPAGDQIELAARAPGTYGVEVRSTGGTTRYDLRWAPSVESVLCEAAGSALVGRRNAAGVVVLTDLAAALVVQAALRLGYDEAEVAEEALDLFTARVRDEVRPDPWLATYLCGELDRSGDAELVELAAAGVEATTEFRPGLGLAAGHLALARWVVGGTAQTAPRPGRRPLISGADPLVRAAVDLEAALAGGSEPPDPALIRLGRWLGAGLTGAAVVPQSPGARAYATAVLAAVPDVLDRATRGAFVASASAVGRWTEAGVLADLAGTPVGRGHAWLAIAARTR